MLGWMRWLLGKMQKPMKENLWQVLGLAPEHAKVLVHSRIGCASGVLMPLLLLLLMLPASVCARRRENGGKKAV